MTIFMKSQSLCLLQTVFNNPNTRYKSIEKSENSELKKERTEPKREKINSDNFI